MKIRGNMHSNTKEKVLSHHRLWHNIT